MWKTPHLQYLIGVQMQPIQIIKGTTRAAVKISPSDPAASYIQMVTRHNLTDYDFNPRYRKFFPNKRYLNYDVGKSMLFVPINALDILTSTIEEYGCEYVVTDEKPYKTRDLSIKMKDSFVPREHQIPAIEYLKQDEPARKGLAIQTGSGKTVSSIAGMLAYGKVGMIAVSRLHHQWVRSIFDFTTATKEQVCVIQGFQSLANAMEMESKPEIFVFSLETLREYCKHQGAYADVPPFQKFCEYFGIGFKIFDEVHLNFHACTLIDLSCNIPNNVYLTATFTSGNPATKKIFDLVYPSNMQFGKDNIEKYTIAYLYSFFGNVPERAVTKQRGYDHKGYEKYLLKRPTLLKGFFSNVIHPLIMSHYINVKNPGEKLAIFVTRLNMVDALYKWCVEKYPEYKTVKYIGGVPDSVLVDNDIIITTDKSCGCGTDIKNLRAVINTVSTKSPPAILQVFGRLRKIPGVDTEYADLCDQNISAHRRHQEARIYILRKNAKEIKQLQV